MKKRNSVEYVSEQAKEAEINRCRWNKEDIFTLIIFGIDATILYCNQQQVSVILNKSFGLQSCLVSYLIAAMLFIPLFMLLADHIRKDTEIKKIARWISIKSKMAFSEKVKDCVVDFISVSPYVIYFAYLTFVMSFV